MPKSFRTAIRQKLTMSERPELPDDLTRRLEARFLEDRETLATQFPNHPALRACYPFAP